jgi:hypothetical protein
MRSQIDPDRLMIYGARLIITLWAIFWTWLGLTSSLGEKLPPSSLSLHAAVPALVFVLLLLLAWWTPLLSGWLLLLIGILIVAAYPIAFRHLPVNAVVFVLLTMALPPLTAGLLFLIDRRSKKPWLI